MQLEREPSALEMRWQRHADLASDPSRSIDDFLDDMTGMVEISRQLGGQPWSTYEERAQARVSDPRRSDDEVLDDLVDLAKFSEHRRKEEEEADEDALVEAAAAMLLEAAAAKKSKKRKRAN